MDKEILNTNDKKLLEFCKDKPKTIREIANHLDIANKNVFVRLEKLEKLKLIYLNKLGVGKNTFIKTRQDKKVKKYIKEILTNLSKQPHGEIKQEDFYKLREHSDYDSFSVSLDLSFSDLIENYIRLSEKGKQFLKDIRLIEKEKQFLKEK